MPQTDPPLDPSTARPPAARADDGWTRSWQLTRESLADRVPVAVRARWRVPSSAAVAALAVALAVAGGAGARVLLAADQPSTIRIAPVASATSPPAPASVPSAPSSVPPSGRSTAPSSALPTASGVVVVDVVGQVRRPGIVRLPAGSRVVDAVTAAGGAGPQAAVELINLARPLVDGEQILVPRPGQQVTAAPGQAPAPGAAGPGAAPLDLNTATESQLDQLPGIGPVLAGRIVAWRTAHGRFSAVDELAEVGGIGDRLLDQLRPLVRV